MTPPPRDVDAESTTTGRFSPAGPERETTHLPLHAARDDASPTGAHALRAEFVEHEVARLQVTPRCPEDAAGTVPFPSSHASALVAIAQLL